MLEASGMESGSRGGGMDGLVAGCRAALGALLQAGRGCR